ncbi:hypothetical protein MRX96_028333 [Rhipicephalus microplus]
MVQDQILHGLRDPDPLKSFVQMGHAFTVQAALEHAKGRGVRLLRVAAAGCSAGQLDYVARESTPRRSSSSTHTAKRYATNPAVPSAPPRAVQPQDQVRPRSSWAPDITKSTWVDKVAGKGETRATARSGSWPQPVAEKIQALERENTFLRKELSDIKALLKTPQPQEQRESNASEPPIASNPARGAKKRAGPALEAEEPLTMSSNVAHLTVLVLEQFRTDILFEINPLKLQLTEIIA